MDELPFYGEVEAESVLYMTKWRAYRIPTPPTMVNDRNYIASLSQLGKFLADEAEGLGATILPETVRGAPARRRRPRARRANR